jgi:hypothetical protein
MLIRSISILIPALACLALLPGETFCRGVKKWPYKELFENSTLVVVVKPVSERDATATDRAAAPSRRSYLTGVITSFKVLTVVKGEYKQKDLEILHFRIKDDSSMPGNGPKLVSFIKNRGRGEHHVGGRDDYMLFLKKDKDGRLGFVSGQFDPLLSVK